MLADATAPWHRSTKRGAPIADPLVLIAAATHHDIVRADVLPDLVNRLDGVKMLAPAT
jgi:hypothetical protein